MSGASVTEWRRRLEDIGDAPLRELASPENVAGADLRLIVEPQTGEALGAVLATLNGARRGTSILGAGTKRWLGNPLRRDVEIGLSTRGLAGIEELDEADGVVLVGAGTELRVLREKALAAGWLLAIDPPGEAGTVGGALATALPGVRQPGFGPVRDSVLGLETALASGERTRCGSRVVKNVTGYDLAKLYVGSLGTLGVIERAWLRLRAVPERSQVLQAAIDLDAEAHARVLEVARSAAVRVISVVSESLCDVVRELGEAPGGTRAARLIVELAGDRTVVDRDAARLARELDAHEVSPTAVDGLAAARLHEDPIGVRARLHVLPDRLARVSDGLLRAGARLLVEPIPGTVFAWFEASLDDGEDPWWLDRVQGSIDEARRAGGGESVIESLPDWARGRSDVFGGSEALGLMRALKQRFDPHAILNPGRFVGGL